MPFEFVQIPVSGQGEAKDELNKLLRMRKVVSERARKGQVV